MPLLTNHFYKFGDFTLDTDQRVLLREGKPMALTPKVFDTLLILVENSGRIVEKDELMRRLWPDTFVEEANITFNIQQLRRILSDMLATHATSEQLRVAAIALSLTLKRSCVTVAGRADRMPEVLKRPMSWRRMPAMDSSVESKQESLKEPSIRRARINSLHLKRTSV